MLGGNYPGSFGDPLQGMGMDLAPYRMPIIGGFFQDPNELHQRQQFHNMAANYAAYRPQMQQAQTNAMNNSAQLMQPMQNAMAAAYGGGTSMNVPTQSPVSPQMAQIGNPVTGAYSPVTAQRDMMGSFLDLFR